MGLYKRYSFSQFLFSLVKKKMTRYIKGKCCVLLIFDTVLIGKIVRYVARIDEK